MDPENKVPNTNTTPEATPETPVTDGVNELHAPSAVYSAQPDITQTTPEVKSTSLTDMNSTQTPGTEQVFTAEQNMKPGNKKKAVGFIVLICVIFILILLSGGFIYAGYTDKNLPLISEEQQIKYQKWYATLPFVPKTPRHVLLLAADSNSIMKTYEFSTSASFDVSQKQNIGGLSSISFDFSSKGKADITDRKSPKFDFDLQAKSASPFVPFSANVQLLMKDNVFYFNVKELSGIIGSFVNTEPIINKWFKEDLTNLDTEARRMIEETQNGNTTAAEGVQKWFLKVLTDGEIMQRVTLLKDEQVGEESCYHLHAVPQRSDIVKIINLAFEEQKKPLSATDISEIEKMLDSIDNFSLDVWVGKNTHIVRKSSAKLRYIPQPAKQGRQDMPVETLSPLSGLEDLIIDAAFSVEVPAVNKTVTIDAPKESSDISEFYPLLQSTYMTSYQNATQSAQRSGTPSAELMPDFNSF